MLSAANALLDMTLESLAVTAQLSRPARRAVRPRRMCSRRCRSQGVVARGRLLSAGARTLDIAGEHLWLRLPLAQLTAGPLRFDATHPRVGELVFTATRAVMGAEDRR